MRAFLALCALALFAAPAAGQQPPAPGQPPGPLPGQPQRPATPPVVAMEDLVRQGYEVKAMQQYGAQPGQFVVMLQRSGDVRTCLMRIERPQGGQPVRRTVCF